MMRTAPFLFLLFLVWRAGPRREAAAFRFIDTSSPARGWSAFRPESSMNSDRNMNVRSACGHDGDLAFGGEGPPSSETLLVEGEPGDQAVLTVAWNSTNSTAETRLALAEARSGSADDTQEKPLLLQFLGWWERVTENRTGLLILLVPSLISQLLLLQTVVPFCFDRLIQYMQPFYLTWTLLLSSSRGVNVLRASLLGCSLISMIIMIADTYRVGSYWSPALAREDSYAVVTGASSQLSQELARIFYSKGFHVVLVVNADYENVDGVFSFSDELANERTEVLGDASGVLRGNREIEGSIPLAQHTPQSSSVTMMSGSPLGLRGATEEVAEEKRQPIAFVRAVSPAAPWWRGWSSGILHRLWQTPALAEQHSDSRYTITADATNSANGPAAKVPIGRQNRYRDVKVVVVSDERGNGADPGGSLDAYSKLQGAGLAEKVDILVVHPEAYSSARGPFHEGDVTRYTHIMDVNMQGTVNMVKSLVPHMLRRKGARLAIVSSVAGSALAPERAVFGASKAFLHAFAASLRREYLTDGLLVTLAIPGPLRGQDAGAPMTTGNIMTQPQRRISLEGLDIDEDCIIHKAWGITQTAAEAARDIHRGIHLGRDQVVPGRVNSIFVHTLNRVLPPAFTAFFTRSLYRPVPNWMKLFVGNPRIKTKQKKNRFGYMDMEVVISEEDEEAARTAVRERGAARQMQEDAKDADVDYVEDELLVSMSANITQSAFAKANHFRKQMARRCEIAARRGRRKMRRSFEHFWTSPLIDYSALRKRLLRVIRNRIEKSLDTDESGSAGDDPLSGMAPQPGQASVPAFPGGVSSPKPTRNSTLSQPHSEAPKRGAEGRR